MLLAVDGLSMRFGGLLAVDDVSFGVAAGRITAVIGPNGAGKTTLFNCITGFYRPSAGSLRFAPPELGPGQERRLERMAGFRIAQAGIARTFQNIRLFAGMTALENLVVAQHVALSRAGGFGVLALLGTRGFARAERAAVARARGWLERVGLVGSADLPAGALSYGDQRRLEIARAMCTGPRLLCLDEPAAGLNPRESEALRSLLAEIRDEGCAILLIEHDMGVVMRVSDHVVVLDHGRRIAAGSPAAVRADPAVIAAYLGVEA